MRGVSRLVRFAVAAATGLYVQLAYYAKRVKDAGVKAE